ASCPRRGASGPSTEGSTKGSGSRPRPQGALAHRSSSSCFRHLGSLDARRQFLGDPPQHIGVVLLMLAGIPGLVGALGYAARFQSRSLKWLLVVLALGVAVLGVPAEGLRLQSVGRAFLLHILLSAAPLAMAA
ncbi:unnamed protein product, partial [Polarella glacialis]